MNKKKKDGRPAGQSTKWPVKISNPGVRDSGSEELQFQHKPLTCPCLLKTSEGIN